jgi:hypothetical protein
MVGLIVKLVNDWGAITFEKAFGYVRNVIFAIFYGF